MAIIPSGLESPSLLTRKSGALMASTGWTVILSVAVALSVNGARTNEPSGGIMTSHWIRGASRS